MTTGHPFMQAHPHQPLSIAAKVLSPQTIQAIRKLPEFHLQAWKILDRWAFNSPEMLAQLEAQGEIVLMSRLLDQQAVEHQALMDSTHQLQNGMTEHEILEMCEIHTEL